MVSNWEPAHLWWMMPPLGPRLQQPLACWLRVCTPASLPPGRGGACMQQASSPLVSLSPVFCAVSLSYLPQIVLGHSGPFLSLRTNDATRTSLPSPCSLVADRNSGLFHCRQLWLGAYSVCSFLVLPVLLPSEVPKLPTDPPVRGFPTVWKLLLLHDSVPRTGLHP